MMKYCWLFILFLGTGWLSARGQSQDTLVNRSRPLFPRLLELSISGASYRGDLGNYQKWSAIFQAAYRFNGFRRFNGRLGLTRGFVTGENRFYTFRDGEGNLTTPNTFFRANLLSFVYELEYNLYFSRHVRVYLSQGIGLVRFVVKDAEGQNLADLTDTRPFEEIYGNFAFQLPTGLGFHYLFRNGFGVGGWLGFWNIQTDFLDNISAWATKAEGIIFSIFVSPF
ncbi:MAG: hypothetical protein HC913_04735 [Microscillaceae bacterium]|nr:hypothetical protein [Microscillaceae bacterium]